MIFSLSVFVFVLSICILNSRYKTSQTARGWCCVGVCNVATCNTTIAYGQWFEAQLFLLPAIVSSRVRADRTSAWALTNHTGDTEAVFGSRLWTSTVLAIVVIGKVNQMMKIFLFLPLYNSVFQINLKFIFHITRFKLLFQFKTFLGILFQSSSL